MAKTVADVFAELDPAARANLNARGVQEYEKYKARLLADGDSSETIEAVLRGFIWDSSETGSDYAAD